MEEIGFFTQLSNEIINMDVQSFIFVALIFYVAFYFSKRAESLFFHLLYSLFGIYILIKIEMTSIIYNVDLLVALGLLIPQIRFIIQFVKDTIQTIKMMTANTYYFFVTIYYKFLRFIHWVKSTYIMIKTFFTSFSSKKESYQEYKKQENTSYKKEDKKSEYYEQSYTKYEKSKREKPKQESDEFKRFESDSAYDVLGVSADDDYKRIKKVYHELLRIYHPDLNHENIEKYTEITQNINNAWEKVEGWKK